MNQAWNHWEPTLPWNFFEHSSYYKYNTYIYIYYTVYIYIYIHYYIISNRCISYTSSLSQFFAHRCWEINAPKLCAECVMSPESHLRPGFRASPVPRRWYEPVHLKWHDSPKISVRICMEDLHGRSANITMIMAYYGFMMIYMMI